MLLRPATSPSLRSVRGLANIRARTLLSYAIASICTQSSIATSIQRNQVIVASVTASGASTLRNHSTMSIPVEMNAVDAKDSLCRIVKRPVPVPGPGEALVRVHYTAINRADTLQRKGMYAPPKGATDILGLEMAGEIAALSPPHSASGSSTVASSSHKFDVGTRVMALLSGGGNAEYVTVPLSHCLEIPPSISYKSAAAIPETWLTAYQLLFMIANVTSHDTVLVHAAASGVGTAAVQMAVSIGASVIAVAGSDEKLAAVKSLGAHHTINYKTEEAFSGSVKRVTGDKGATVILDPVGGSFWRQNMESIAIDGRWVLYGTMGGGSIDGGFLAQALRKRVNLLATTLRSRTDEYKADLTAQFAERFLPLLGNGTLKPIVDREFPLAGIQTAHEYMESNANIGKIVIQVA